MKSNYKYDVSIPVMSVMLVGLILLACLRVLGACFMLSKILLTQLNEPFGHAKRSVLNKYFIWLLLVFLEGHYVMDVCSYCHR